jgi:hypothetical protein
VSSSRGLEEGRAAFHRGEWADAHELLAAADAASPLDPADLDRLATAAYLTGADAASIDARTRAHAGFLERGDPIGAARSAFWLGLVILDRPSQQAQAAGWIARAQRLIDEVNEPCVECSTASCRSPHRSGAW